MGQQQSERRDAEDGHPDHELATDAVTDRSADDRARGHSEKKQEQEELGVLRGDVEFVDQVKRVVAREAREVEIFGEDERREDGDDADGAGATQRQARGEGR